jgi:hypothetical protein
MNKKLWYITKFLERNLPREKRPDIKKIELTRAYMEGYEQGRKDERLVMVSEKMTPNTIREALGLETVEKGEIK